MKTNTDLMVTVESISGGFLGGAVYPGSNFCKKENENDIIYFPTSETFLYI